MNVNKELIEKQAKEILDKFASALEKVEKENDTESYADREEFERSEKAGSDFKKSKNSKDAACTDNKGFKQRILDNAPDKDDDFIIAEKGGWK